MSGGATSDSMDEAKSAGTSAGAVEDSIRRALDAAEAANDAAQEMAELSAAHRAFAEAVIAGQRRNTMIAAGALGGAVVALALGGLVYFRSVADLRLAAAVQSEAAALLVAEVKQIDHISDAVEAQQEVMKAELLALLEEVKDEIRRAGADGIKADPMDAQIAASIRDGVREDMEGMRNELMEALAEIKVDGIGGGMTELRALLEEVRAGGTAPAPAAAAPGTAGSATPAATPRQVRPSRLQAPEPNPFVYP